MKTMLKLVLSLVAANLMFAMAGRAADSMTPCANAAVLEDRNESDDGTGAFKFAHVPPIATTDAATTAKISIIDGAADDASGDVAKLVDGRGPTEEDQPDENFFFAAGTSGGRLMFDLGRLVEIARVSTYSWHPGSRAPQVYELYASDGTASDFTAKPVFGSDVAAHGWTLIAKVDTRGKYGNEGGQYAVSIVATNGILGKYRYLLMDCHCTDQNDRFSNTFYSEVDVTDANGSPASVAMATPAPAVADPLVKTFVAVGGRYHITIDVSRVPDMADWAFNELAPVTQEWYSKLVAALPSEGFQAPETVEIRFRDHMNAGTPAYTTGHRITLNTAWFRKNEEGEARGAVVHEMVHVVQQYWGHRTHPDATPFPGWLTEGIPDYLRFFKYEPQNHGADDVWLKRHHLTNIHYNDSYRITANFLDWVSQKYDPDIVVKLNTAGREGTYTPAIWKTATHKSLEELGAEWLAEKKLSASR